MSLFQSVLKIMTPVSFSIVILIVLKKTMLRKIPSKWSLMLWIPILIQLLFPVPLELPVSHEVPILFSEIQTPIIEITEHMEKMIEPAVIQDSSIAFSIYPEMIWMTGLLVLSVLFLHSAWLLNKRIQYGSEVCHDARVHAFLPKALHIKPVVLPHLTSAALPLTRWDILLLPKHTEHLSDKELKLMITHEIMHLTSHHRVLSAALLVLKIMYWFNPLIWLMSSLIHQEMEMMCDEAIAEQYAEDIALYGRLLIQMQSSLTSFEGIALSKSARNTKERLGNLMLKKHKSLFCLLAVLLVLCLSTLPLIAQNTELSEASQKYTPEELITQMVQPIDHPKITCRWGCYAGHEAIDVINTKDRYGNVYAVYAGVVIETGYDSYRGNYIVIDHLNGYQTRYHHLSEIHVSMNETVHQKDIIGLIGTTGVTTGPHLHLQLISEGSNINIDSLFEE